MIDDQFTGISVFDTPPESLPPFDLRQILEEMSWSLANLIGAEQLFMYRTVPSPDRLEPYFALGNLSIQDKHLFYDAVIEPESDILVTALMEQPEPILIDDNALRIHYQASIAAGYLSKTLLAAPISSRGQLLGMALFTWPNISPGISQSQLRMVGPVARAMAQAIENVRLYEYASRQLSEMRSLHQITMAILEKVDAREMIELVCAQACRLTDATASALYLTESGDRLCLLYAFSPDNEVFPAEAPQTSPESLAVLRKEPVIINPGPGSSSERSHVLAVPLIANEMVIGVLTLVQKGYLFSPDNIRIASLLADQAAVAIEHARLLQQAGQAAILEERSRLARDLHDSVNQSLYSINLYSRAALRQLRSGNSTAVEKNLVELGLTARNALGEMRLLIFELRPPLLEQKGLIGALENRLKMVEERSGLQVSLDHNLSSRLSQPVEAALYWVAVEALNNVIKHAQAKNIAIHLHRTQNSVVMIIEDNGVGFDTQLNPEGGFGLKSIRERIEMIKGFCTIVSNPGSGTKITVEVKDESNPNFVG